MIPIAKPLIGDEEQREVARVLGSGSLAQGPEVAAFEAEFAAFCGTKHALATTNGTTALHLALLAAGVGPGDEVITTPFSFFASASSIRMAGAKPVFVDLERDGYCLDPMAVVAAITPRTKAVMPVHLYGELCDMDALREACDAVPIIEDACQAHGADAGGRAGSHGLAGCFSFYPTKNMTTGEGGMVTPDDDDVAAAVAQLRAHGQGERYEHLQLGFNYRMTELQAALGLSQMSRLSTFVAHRLELAKRYDLLLADSDFERPLLDTDDNLSSWHLYVIRLPEGSGPLARRHLFEKLRSDGIGVNVHYIPVTRQPFYRKLGFVPDRFPVAENYYERAISIPLYHDMTKSQQDTVVKCLLEPAGYQTIF